MKILKVIKYLQYAMYLLMFKAMRLVSRKYWVNRLFVTKSQALHDDEIEAIKTEFNTFIRLGKKLTLSRNDNDSHCTRKQQYKVDCNKINIAHLNKIIGLDPNDKNVLIVEPLASMETIVKHCARKYNKSPCVVPEFKGITIGGTIAGGGLESSSFKYGMVENTVEFFDIIVGDGTLIRADRNNNSDLFHGTMWSLGTTGCIVLVGVRLRDIKPYVALQYHHIVDKQAAIDKFNELVEQESCDFFEGLALSPTSYIMITGRFSNNKFGNHLDLTRYWSPWYIEHVKDISKQDTGDALTGNSPYTETMSTSDYYFRWDRGIFWLGNLKINPTLTNRLLLGWMFDMESHHIVGRMKPDNVNEQTRILADVGPPIEKLRDILDYNEEQLQVYPLWLLPFKLYKNEEKIFSPDRVVDSKFCIDVGIYGKMLKTDKSFIEVNRELEHFVHQDCKGMKGFETVCYYTKEEFDGLFDVDQYDVLRKKYNSHAKFPSLFDKINFNYGEKKQ